MITKKRSLAIKNTRFIIEKYVIKSQREFIDYYDKEFATPSSKRGKNNKIISQSTASRYFKFANVVPDYVKRRLVIESEVAAKKKPLIETLLECYSYGKYHTNSSQSNSLWIRVKQGSESGLANELHSYCKKSAAIIPGYGCIYIQCFDKRMYDKMNNLVSTHYLDKDI